MSSISFVVLVLALFVIPNVDSIRCYDYTSTNMAKTNMKTWIDCPMNAQYCYKSYLESRDFNNDKTHVEGRACGTDDLCIQNGCVGSSTDKACCCRGDLCNSASLSQLFASLCTVLAVYYFKN